MGRCGIALVSALAVGVAHAEEPVRLVPGPPVVADGVSPATLRFWSPAIDAGAKFKLKIDGVLVEGAHLGSDGLATVMWTPPRAAADGVLPVDIRVKGAAGKARAMLELAVEPATAGPVRVSFSPGEVRLGEDGSVQVQLDVPPGEIAQASRSLVVHSSMGIIDTVTHVAGDRFVARWRPPQKLSGSAVVLFAVADAATGGAVLGYGQLPVRAPTQLRFDAPEGSRNLLTVAGESFGPVVAMADGVHFAPALSPAARTGTLRTITDDSDTQIDVDMPDPGGERLTFVPVPVGVSADPGAPVLLHLLAFAPDGSPLASADLSLVATLGDVSAVTPSGTPGLFEATWAPPATAGTAKLTATLGEASVSRSVKLVPPPARASLAIEPPALSDGQRRATFTMSREGPAGPVLTPRPETWMSGAKAVGSVKGRGPHTLVIQPMADAPDLYAVVLPSPAATGLPPARLVIAPLRPDADAVAGGSVPMVVAALDVFDHPVPNQVLRLAATHGGGSVTDSVKTGASGVVVVDYVLGAEPGPSRVTVTGAGLDSAATVFQSTATAGASPPPSGTADRVRRDAAFIELLSPVHLRR